MSIRIFKDWLTECQTKDPILFEAINGAFDVFFESTEDVVNNAKQTLDNKSMSGDGIDVNDPFSDFVADEDDDGPLFTDDIFSDSLDEPIDAVEGFSK